MNHNTFGWCFIGSGSITRRVMRDLSRYAKLSRLVSVYSPNPAHAEALATEYGAVWCKSAEEAIGYQGVDGVYIATPHTLHLTAAEVALRLGKPVLCEKPLTPNLEQTARLADLAEEKGLYLAEAMWTRYNPVICKVKEWILEGKIGKVHCVEAEFGGRSAYNPASRIFSPALAGGAILDIGVYPISLAQMVYGDEMPRRIAAVGNLTPDGVDGDAGILLHYPCGGIATLFTSVTASTPSMAKICGEEGVILIHAPFWKSRGATLNAHGKQERFTLDEGDYEGFHFEFDGVAKEILAGKTESDKISLSASCRVAAITDEVRRQLGVVYPFE
ncbi:MAG: Gfo/Idh/MocA family oxidoreductase [Clostridia bacterium]|nr:Gfo/Idh/MocA family oxidoreductase [Clostridia bacterium]